MTTSSAPGVIASAAVLVAGLIWLVLASQGWLTATHSPGKPTRPPDRGSHAARGTTVTLPAPVAYGIGIALVAAGSGLALFVAGPVTCTFDRDAGLFVFGRRRVIGSGERSYPLEEVAGAEVQESKGDGTGHPSSRTYRTAIVMSDQRRIPLGLVYVGGRERQERIVERVEAFLRGN